MLHTDNQSIISQEQHPVFYQPYPGSRRPKELDCGNGTNVLILQFM